MKKIHSYKYGEITYRILRFISSEEGGKSYMEIVKFAFELTYGKGTYTNKWRGYYSDAFIQPHNKIAFGGTEYFKPAGSLAKLLNKASGRRGKYTLNKHGISKMNNFK